PGAPPPRRLPPPARDERLRRAPHDLRDARGPQKEPGAARGDRQRQRPRRGRRVLALLDEQVRGAALADSLGYELAEHGVSVTLISPGFVESEIRQVDNRGVLRTEKPAPPIAAAMVMATPTAARKIVGAAAGGGRGGVM